jgi:monoamine oxidase
VTSEIFAESEGGAQTTRFVGGTSEIPKRLAALIADHIVLEAHTRPTLSPCTAVAAGWLVAAA